MITGWGTNFEHMKTINFRPLRRIKKTGKVCVASYMQWNKLRCANYSDFNLIVNPEYEAMDKSEYVYDHDGELLYHFNYSPWDVFVYTDTDGFVPFDELKGLHNDYTIVRNWSDWVTRMWRGADCNGTPTFSHHTANHCEQYKDMQQFEPLTVGYVLDWLSWFIYNLEKSKVKVKGNET